MVDFTKLSRGQLDAMAIAGREIQDCERVLHKTGDTVVSETLRGGGIFYEWNHYPDGDVYDPESHAQYYYHAHPPQLRAGDEHGHFHTFLRPRGMPAGTAPLMLPELAIANAPAQPDVEHPSSAGAMKMAPASTAAVTIRPECTARRLAKRTLDLEDNRVDGLGGIDDDGIQARVR